MKKCFEHPNKKRYNTKQNAESAMLMSECKDLRIYYCDTCSGWHLTSKTKKNNFSLTTINKNI
jgi:hypothetical protein